MSKQSMCLEYQGVGILDEESRIKKYDCWCPLCGSAESTTNNYWQSNCDARQKDPEQRETCYPKCKVKDVPSKVARYASHFKRLTKQEKQMIYDMVKSSTYYSLKEISDATGVSKTSVAAYRDKMWGKMIPEYVTAGLTNDEITQKIGASHLAIARAMRGKS